MLRIRQLVLYRDGDNGLLSELSSIQERVAGADAGNDLDKAERSALTDRYTALMQKSRKLWILRECLAFLSDLSAGL